MHKHTRTHMCTFNKLLFILYYLRRGTDKCLFAYVYTTTTQDVHTRINNMFLAQK